MKYYARYIFILASLLRMPIAAAQQLDSVLLKIRAFNEVHAGGIGQAEVITDQYRNYMKLQQMATTEDLVSLTDDSNGVVNCYAAFELINRNYQDMLPLFAKLLKADKRITIIYGCIKMSESELWYDVYMQYLGKRTGEAVKARRGMDSCVTDSELEQYIFSCLSQDGALLGIDSCILFSDNYIRDYKRGWPLIHRLYPASYLPRIEHLAFETWSKEAMKYLRKHYGSKYDPQIKQALLAYMQGDDCKKWGYYSEVAELIKYRDEAVNQAVVKQMTSDKAWKKNYRAYKKLFAQYDLKEKLPSRW